MHPWDPVCRPRTDLVRPVPVDPTGRTGPTRGQASGPGWRRSSHGLYVPSHVDGEVPEQRVLEQAVRLPPGGAVTGWAACRLWGGAFFDGLGPDGRTRLPVPLNLGPTGYLAPGPDAVVIRSRLRAGEAVGSASLPRTRRARALVDAMRLSPGFVEAVVCADMGLAAAIASPDGLASEVASLSRLPGLALARAALRLASEHSRSPAETRLRLLGIRDAGLPREVLVNCPVHDLDGRLIGVADLLDPTAGLVVEYDGAEHRRATRQAADVQKDEGLRNAGLEVTRVTGPDMREPARVVRRLRDARARALRARARPDHPRAWRASPPAPWVEEVVERREAYERWREETRR